MARTTSGKSSKSSSTKSSASKKSSGGSASTRSASRTASSRTGSSRTGSSRSTTKRGASTSRSKAKGFPSSPHTRTTTGRRIFEPIDQTPIERKKAGEKLPKSLRNIGEPWEQEDVRELRELSKKNTPTRIIGMKLGRDESSIRSKASNEGISLKPANRSPYGPRRNSAAAKRASLQNLKKARAARNA